MRRLLYLVQNSIRRGGSRALRRTSATLLVIGLVLGLGSRIVLAQQLTLGNVPVYEVSEPGFLSFDGIPLYDAQFSAEGRSLIVEPVAGYSLQSRADFLVHGLQPGDQVRITAPNHEVKTVTYLGDGSNQDLWLYRTGPYQPAPTPPVWGGSVETASSYGAAFSGAETFLAGSLYWPQYPISINGRQLGQSSLSGASLTFFHGRLYMAWAGVGNNLLNVMSSGDSGVTWEGKVTLPYHATTNPALAVFGDRLALAWTEGRVGLLFSSNGTEWGDFQFAPGVSTLSPALATYAGKLFLALVDLGPSHTIYVQSWDGAHWSPMAFLPETTAMSPGLSVSGGRLVLSWAGEGNNRINTLQNTDGSLNFSDQHIYQLTTTRTPLLVDFCSPLASPAVGLPLLLYGFNDLVLTARYFDDGTFTPPNGDFENGVTGWSTYTTNPAFVAKLSPAAASGATALLEDEDGIVYTDVAGVIPGHGYTVSAYVNASASASAAGFLWAHDTLGMNLVVSPSVTPQGWQKISVHFVATQTGKLRIHLSRSPGAGDILWDTVSVTPD
jgi:hypothetical protein